MLAQAGAMPSPGFNWEYHRDLWLDANEPEHKQAVNERWRAYFDKLARAGGYDAYARDERRKLVAIGDKFLGLDLAPQVIPIVVDFWGHPGDPWFSFSDLPDARGGAAFPGLRGGSANDDYDWDRAPGGRRRRRRLLRLRTIARRVAGVELNGRTAPT